MPSLIGDLLDQAQMTAGLYRRVLDSIVVLVIFTGADGAVLHANAHAAQMLEGQVLLRVRNSVLQAQSPIVSRALLEAIAAAHADGILGSRGIGLPISTAGQPPPIVYVLPLSEGVAPAMFPPASAAIFISTIASPVMKGVK